MVLSLGTKTDVSSANCLFQKCKQMPQRVIDLRNKILCDKEQMIRDVKAWVAYEAHKAGGKFVAYHNSLVNQAHVAAYSTRNKEIRFLVIDWTGNRITDAQVIESLGRDLIAEACEEALVPILQRNGYDVWDDDLVHELLDLAVDHVLESACTPAEAAEYAVGFHKRRWALN